ncbi:hypothetical protein PTKIN_Ptkin02bG0093700 [Pterospermum kingtungense]
MKANCDGGYSIDTVNSNDFVAGIGVIVRDEEGFLVDGIAKKVKARGSVEVEAFAVHEGLKVAESLHLRKVPMGSGRGATNGIRARLRS